MATDKKFDAFNDASARRIVAAADKMAITILTHLKHQMGDLPVIVRLGEHTAVELAHVQNKIDDFIRAIETSAK